MFRRKGWRGTHRDAASLRAHRAHQTCLPAVCARAAVLLDEASMLDVQVAAAVLRALRPDARLVLIGDPNQLPPVAPGDALQDMIASGLFPRVSVRVEPAVLLVDSAAAWQGRSRRDGAALRALDERTLRRGVNGAQTSCERVRRCTSTPSSGRARAAASWRARTAS